jgi:GTP-binding protein HflX
MRTGIPIVSIIGYTNAGKSTLFNLLTKSGFQVGDKLFSTLDTATRRWRFPNNREVVITDTVGLIRDLPKDLIGAFRPTFDELQESDLLVHLVDVSNPSFPEHIKAVDEILLDLDLDHLPRLLVFNKEDRVPQEEVSAICQKYEAVSISALRPGSLERFFEAMERKLWEERDSKEPSYPVRLTNEEAFGI